MYIWNFKQLPHSLKSKFGQYESGHVFAMHLSTFDFSHIKVLIIVFLNNCFFYFLVLYRSMEECENLCTRLAIMVNGNFRCLGSPQHVKHRHGEGYTLILHLLSGNKPADIGAISQFMNATFPNNVLKVQSTESRGWFLIMFCIIMSKKFHFLFVRRCLECHGP